MKLYYILISSFLIFYDIKVGILTEERVRERKKNKRKKKKEKNRFWVVSKI